MEAGEKAVNAEKTANESEAIAQSEPLIANQQKQIATRERLPKQEAEAFSPEQTFNCPARTSG